MNGAVDLVVVGAGPAGAALATLAARAGARTALVERARFPRDKVCGEFVAAEGAAVLERIGVLGPLRSAGGVWIDGWRLCGPDGAGIGGPLPPLASGESRALGITRARLDTALVEAAVAAGAELLSPTEVVDAVWGDDGAATGVRLRRPGATAERVLRSAVVVAADGRGSRLARRLHPRLAVVGGRGGSSWFGLKCHVADVTVRDVELHLFPGGYAGVGPVEDDRVNLCLLVRARALRRAGGSPDRLLERLCRHASLGPILAGARRCGPWLGVGPLGWGVRRPASHGLVFVGDAAGTVDPFSGEGMAHALVGAELAWPVVSAAIARGVLGAEGASTWDRLWRERFESPTKRVRRIGRLLERSRLAAPVIRGLGGRAGRRFLPSLVGAARTAPLG